MVKRNRTDIAREIDKPHPGISSSARQPSKLNVNSSDDIIVWLANAHENKRARQVVEWESSQPVYLRSAV